MPFSFLNPWLWVGALAIGVPLWLHLRRKKQENLLRFSTLRFLEDMPQPRRMPLRLRDAFLFALRALVILLVACAFARPYLKNLNTLPVKESRVYVLDNTLSHQAADGFVHQRDQLAADLQALDNDVQAAVVELTGMPRVVASFGDTHASAAESIRALSPSYQRGSYLAAFRQANNLLENSLGEKKRIIFFGDNQQNQWGEDVSTPPFLRQVEVEVRKDTAAALPNVSLSDPRVQRLFLGDKSLVNVTLRLTHTGPAKSANVVVKANGQAVFNRTVNLESQPQTVLVQAQWEAEPNAWVRGEAVVEGRPDSLAGDNRVFFSLAPVLEGRVALLAQSSYLRLALSPEIMRGQWTTRVLDPSNLGAEFAGQIDADVLCLESGYLQSAEARKLVTRCLTNGCGVLLIVNRSTPAIDGFLRDLGFEAGGTVQPGPGSYEKFQFVLSNHPIFHPFLSPEYGNLMEIKVSEYVRLKSSQSMPLVFGEKGDGLFFAGRKDRGKLLVCAFGLDREHTTWPIHQSFIPFLDLVLQAARAEDPVPTTYEPGELTTLQLRGAVPAEVVLRDGARELGRYVADRGTVRLRLPDQPGLYSVTYDDSSEIHNLFSVNPSPKESDLVYQGSPEALTAWRLNDRDSAGQPPMALKVGGLRMAAVLQQRFWWWMVLAALLVLLVETVWAGAKKEPA